MGISNDVKKHKRIIVDTAPIIYLIEENSNYSDLVETVFKDYNHTVFTSEFLFQFLTWTTL